MNKIAIAGILATAMVFSALGVLAIAQENVGDTMAESELDNYKLAEGTLNETTDRPLLTAEQIESMRATVQQMRDAHATRTEIRETVQAMAHDYVQNNLESYGLVEEDIVVIQAKITELMDKMLEIRETAFELREQDMNRQDIRETLQPLIDEAKAIRGELADMLDQYGILPPEIQQPGMGCGGGGCEGEGRQGRFGRRP